MISTLFLKELKETLRDRRTVFMMIVIPTLIFPLIMNVYVSVSKSFTEEAATKELKVGFYSKDEKQEVLDLFLESDLKKNKIDLKPFSTEKELNKEIKEGKLDFGLFIPTTASKHLIEKEQVNIQVVYNGTDVGMEERASGWIEQLSEKIKKSRYIELKLNENIFTPFDVKYTNIASDKEMIGKLAGGILPYIFIVFGFLGCMYPAIDLFTGEKERKTMETLLTTPVPRWQILVGKMGVVVFSGLMASTFALVGLFASIELSDTIEDPKLLDIIHSILSLKFIVLLYLLLIPLTVFFSGIMVPLAIRAKSFKEAQSTISPLNILVVLPAMIGFMPGLELNIKTAFIPIINIVLSTKELIAGTLNWTYVIIAFFTMLCLAATMVFISLTTFGKENDVLNE